MPLIVTLKYILSSGIGFILINIMNMDNFCYKITLYISVTKNFDQQHKKKLPLKIKALLIDEKEECALFRALYD